MVRLDHASYSPPETMFIIILTSRSSVTSAVGDLSLMHNYYDSPIMLGGPDVVVESLVSHTPKVQPQKSENIHYIIKIIMVIGCYGSYAYDAYDYLTISYTNTNLILM